MFKFNDIYLSYYYFLAILDFLFIKFVTLFNQNLLPTYVYTMWIANFLFFGLTGLIIKNLIDYLKIKRKLLILAIFAFSAIYIGTYYFNLSLAHIGNTFEVIPITFAFLIIFDYFKNKNTTNLILLFFILYAINSMGNVGVIMSLYIAFGFIVTNLIYKDKNSFIMIPLLFVPVFHYIFLVAPFYSILANMPFFNNSINMYLVFLFLTIIGIGLYKLKSYHKFLFLFAYSILILFWFSILIYSIKSYDNYWAQVAAFTDIKANFDRVQDYFSFSTVYETFVNIIHYLFMASILVNKSTRKVGVLLIVVMVFFINPLMYPFYMDNILWLYNRAYYFYLTL